MNTAVQLLPGAVEGRPRADFLSAVPLATREGRRGPIALFAPGALVAYRLRSEQRSRLYVFRTLATLDASATALPGVSPRVALLFDLRSAGRVRLARELFALVARNGLAASALSDGFYVRVGAVLGGRLPRRRFLLDLLARETADVRSAARSVFYLRAGCVLWGPAPLAQGPPRAPSTRGRHLPP